MSWRHARQRKRRARVRADAAVLLERLLARHSSTFTPHEVVEISEMLQRLSPPTGVAVPTVHTGYTK